MARTRTLAELRTEIRNRGEIDSDFVPDSELTRAINVAYADYYGFLVGLNPDYYVSSGNISVSSGTDSYSLPTDFWRGMGVDVQDGSDWYPVERYNWSERHRLRGSGNTKFDTRYRIMGDSIYLTPSPGWSGTLRVWYVPEPSELTNDADTVKSYSGFEEYITLHVLIQYAGKAEEDATLFAAQLNAIKKQITQLAARDDQEPDTVRDVYADSGYAWTRRGSYPRLGRP